MAAIRATCHLEGIPKDEYASNLALACLNLRLICWSNYISAIPNCRETLPLIAMFMERVSITLFHVNEILEIPFDETVYLFRL